MILRKRFSELVLFKQFRRLYYEKAKVGLSPTLAFEGKEEPISRVSGIDLSPDKLCHAYTSR